MGHCLRQKSHHFGTKRRYQSDGKAVYPGQKGIGHQPNEWMKIEDLNTNAKIYALGIYYLGML